MSSSISSAEWPKLFRYSDRALQMDGELAGEGSRIAGILRNFEASCTEYRVAVSHLAGDIQGYAHRAEGTDVWVRKVGTDFQRADQVGSVVFGGDTSRQFLFDILIAERAARVGFAKGLRFRPYAGWGVFFRDTILKGGYKEKWLLYGSRSALQAAGIFKNVRWFSYKYFTKVLTIKSGSWTAAARAAFNRLLRQPGSIFRKLPGAIDAFVRKMPRNSPYLPVSTFKQRIAEAFGKGASLGGKLKSAAGIGLLITTAANIYEYHWGINRHLGLRSRQFVTSTVADGSATLGIIAVSTAVGSLIPIPVVGTVAGFIVGVGLAFVYDKWGKDAWRNAVDGAGKRLQDALTPTQRAEQVQSFKEQRDIARGAADAQWQINQQASSAAILSTGAKQQTERVEALPVTVPFVSQWNYEKRNGGNNCGPASLAMVINYYERGDSLMTAEQVASKIRTNPSGYTDFKIKNPDPAKDKIASLLKEKQLTQEDVADIDELRKHLDLGHPVITLLDNWNIKELPYPHTKGFVGTEVKPVHHIVVVTGYVPDANGEIKEVIVNDPLAVKTTRDSTGKTAVVADPERGQGFRIPWVEFKTAVDRAGTGSEWHASATYRKQNPSL